jgi:malate synthase
MENYVKIGELEIASELHDFVEGELLPKLGMPPAEFWSSLSAIITGFTDRNEQLLQRRDELQAQIDSWHAARRQAELPHDHVEYKEFLHSIGYLSEPCPDFQIDTANVDEEISLQAGPQLVVPVKNARFALNAANARWGSLYDALYGTDAIGEEDGAERAGSYNPKRGAKVIQRVRDFLDQSCPLSNGSHHDATAYRIQSGGLQVQCGGKTTELENPKQLLGYRGEKEAPEAILLINNRLHIEIQLDSESEIGRIDKAEVSDVLLEAAITTIQDCEDSVAAVDGEDKAEVYRNWLGLMSGELQETFIKSGTSLTRVLSEDRQYLSPEGDEFTLPGRSLMLVRNVGHLMRNPAIRYLGEDVFEGILDAVITGAIGAIDVMGKNRLRNSRQGSVYIVKPKMHGPEEVRFACELFSAVESMLGLEANTLKIGIMDEERRTSLSLKQCIGEARSRVVFINTGFLDRTGDEIHTSMEAGPMVPKADMKATRWIQAYEANNVDVGLACGFKGRAQIGKGMWAMPDRMADMLEQKSAHPRAGANTAWVPSPTAAVLHAMHYHQIDVAAVQKELARRPAASIDDILQLPLEQEVGKLSEDAIQSELDNNAQGILGYVVRWVDQGIGCSKVPDIHDVGLMEDRATLRISSQHIANWLHHGICSPEQVVETLLRMAAVVDEQNRHDPLYQAMAVDPDNSIAFQAACELVFSGRLQPNGYTEPVLHRARLAKKAEIRAANG